MKDKKKKANKSSHKIELQGLFEISRSGMGFVMVEGLKKDVLVKPQNFDKALDGDTVKVAVDKYIDNSKRQEGKIVGVSKRNNKAYTGIIEKKEKVAFFVPNDQSAPDFFIPFENLNGAENGSNVVVKFDKWEDGDRKPVGKVVDMLTAKNAGDLAMKEILLENKFPISFDKDVLSAAAALSEEITEEELGKRRDFRGVTTFTIDPVDAKDFDDALSLQKLENGHFEIGVHIADVSHYVKEGSALDQSAYERATSVYLPDRVNPMLPERISNELCSLRPNEDKYCFSAVFEMDENGKMYDRWIGRTVIHSNRRFTYEEAQAMIEGGEGDYRNEILLLDKIAKIYRAERFRNGAINFSSQEVRFVLNEEGKPIDVVVKVTKDSNKMIEEFMLLANRVVAEYVSNIKLNGEPIPFPYRIHDSPDEDKLAPFAAFARKFGYTFDLRDEDAIAKSFNNLLKDVEGKPEQHVLEQLGIRTMAKAAYEIENIGHYGLGFEDYCHFTSPIRRYPDVMVHRVVQQCLDKQPKIDKSMAVKCKHCSERERAAMESERSGNKYKQVEYLQDFIGEDFDAIVSGVSHFGFWAETVQHKCEGLVSIKDLLQFDIFKHDDVDFQLVGMNTGKRFRIGDKVRIKVVAANLEKRQLDFDYVPENGVVKETKPATAKNNDKKGKSKKAKE